MASPSVPPPPVFAGFDTAGYPGDHAMSVWIKASPYVFAAYYLKSPCHPNAGWMGRRAKLQALGWHLLPVYVGQQVAGASPCKANSLTTAQGRADALDCCARMTSEGFHTSSYAYLDLEHSDQFPDSLRQYLSAWTATMAAGDYGIGLYCHAHNAADVRATVSAVLPATPLLKPRFWIAGGEINAFSLGRCQPSGSGIAFADLWQCPQSVTRTFDGIKIQIDENVALLKDPAEA